MHVYIDADGCPVTKITVQHCSEHKIPCTIICDTAHQFSEINADIIVVDKSADSADYSIANRVSPGDLVITQDYGLAAMCLSKKASVLHQDGWTYSNDNIDQLMMQRYLSKKVRNTGAHIKGPKKRTTAQDQAFIQALRKLIQTAVQG